MNELSKLRWALQIGFKDTANCSARWIVSYTCVSYAFIFHRVEFLNVKHILLVSMTTMMIFTDSIRNLQKNQLSQPSTVLELHLWRPNRQLNGILSRKLNFFLSLNPKVSTIRFAAIFSLETHSHLTPSLASFTQPSHNEFNVFYLVRSLIHKTNFVVGKFHPGRHEQKPRQILSNCRNKFYCRINAENLEIY